MKKRSRGKKPEVNLRVHPIVKKFRAFREGKDMTREEAAPKVATSKRTIEAWEQGYRQPSKAAIKLIELLIAE